MHRHLAPTLILFALLAACGDDPCPAGTTPVGDTCVPADGGADSSTDSSTDADTGTDADAGPCGMACTGGTPYCDEDAGSCVACLMDSHCTALDAPECDAMGACVACTGNEACMGRSGTELCAMAGPNTGSCVECTRDERAACDIVAPATEPNVCDANTSACTDEAPGSASVCSPCVSDVQCQEGQLCVVTEFNAGGAMMPVDGTFCLWTEGAPGGPDGSCSSGGRPYLRRRADVTSVDGVTDVVCDLAVSTCAAQLDFRTTSCGDGMMPEMGVDARCGVETLEDAYCVDRDTGPMFDFRCTTRCLSEDDCPSGTTCDMPMQHCSL